MFRNERRKVEQLVDLIETETAGRGALMFGDEDGTTCDGIVLGENGGGMKCDGRRKKSQEDIAQKETVFTLNNGKVRVVLLDWKCPRCTFWNRYKVVKYGIIAASSGTAYTVELMYWWFHDMCSKTQSFRFRYSTTKQLQSSKSYTTQFETNRLYTQAAWNRGNRRTANAAIRNFIHTIN